MNVGLKREVLVESAPPVLPPAGTLGPDSSGTKFRGSSVFMVGGDGGDGMLGRMGRWCLLGWRGEEEVFDGAEDEEEGGGLGEG